MSRAKRRAQAMGATVYATVTAEYVGWAIHQLEYEPDVALIHRIRSKTQRLETFKLRSDRFPASWEGQGVTLYSREGRDGLDIELATP